jgi:hypothetical protein
MIYLWVTDEEWRPFELTDTEELKERGISIGEGASIGDRASIGYGAFIGGGASIGEGAKPIIVRINGSRYPVSYWGEDRVDIGCTSRSIDAWLNDYADIAHKHNFTAAEIEEYRSYVEFIKSVHLKTDKEEKQ